MPFKFEGLAVGDGQLHVPFLYRREEMSSEVVIDVERLLDSAASSSVDAVVVA